MPWNAITRYHVIGSLVGWFIWLAVLEMIVGSERVSEYSFSDFFGIVIGGAVGGIVQLWRLGRSSEIPKFLVGVTCILWLVLVAFLGGLFGQRMFGNIGEFAGILIGIAVAVLLLELLKRATPAG